MAKEKITARWHKLHNVFVDCEIIEEGIEIKGSNVPYTKIKIGNKKETVPSFQIYDIMRPESKPKEGEGEKESKNPENLEGE